MCKCLCELHKKVLVMPWAALALMAAGAGSLLVAFIAEHFFAVAPCILCLFQRVPYALVIILASFALLLRSKDKASRFFLLLCALALFVNAGIAFFHSGVELHWWAGTNGCAVTPLNQADPASLREQLLKTAIAQCDEINFTFLGFSMANWNILASLGLGLFALLASFGPCVNWAKPSCCAPQSPKDQDKKGGGGCGCCG